MTPEAIKRVHDWIDVREALLARVASVDPKLVKERNIRPMYAHLLVALRRATITLVRMITEGQDAGIREATSEATGPGENGTPSTKGPYFMWKGMNYLIKIWQVPGCISVYS